MGRRVSCLEEIVRNKPNFPKRDTKAVPTKVAFGKPHHSSVPPFQHSNPVRGRVGWGYSTANSFLRVFIWALRRATMEECIWETRDSDRSSVAPISFIVISS